MRTKLLVLAVLLVTVPLVAQNRPGAVKPAP
jgi:hypothetical protein